MRCLVDKSRTFCRYTTIRRGVVDNPQIMMYVSGEGGCYRSKAVFVAITFT